MGLLLWGVRKTWHKITNLPRRLPTTCSGRNLVRVPRFFFNDLMGAGESREYEGCFLSFDFHAAYNSRTNLKPSMTKPLIF